MPTVQEKILDDFYQKLTESNYFNDAIIKQLRDLFEADKKLKITDLEKVLSAGSTEDLF